MQSEIKQDRNMWNQIDDFGWHKQDHSPNWGIMTESQMSEIIKNIESILNK